MAELPEVLNFIELIANLGLRNTSRRRTIWQVAYNLDGHFTAEQLLESVKILNPDVSRATIYRTIPELIRSKILREVDVGRSEKYYASTRNVDHFRAQIVCENCDKIIELDAEGLEFIGGKMIAGTGFSFINQRFQVTVSCPCEECKFHSAHAGTLEPPDNAPCIRKSAAAFKIRR